MVQIDPDLSDLIPAFLARKRAEARAIAAAVERSEFHSVADYAHRLKGDGGSYGFDEISAIGADLEAAAQAGERAAVERLAEKILAYLDRVAVVYKSGAN